MTYYVDPVNGDMSNDGSYDNPWSTLQEVFDMDLIETQVLASYPYEPETPLVPKNPGAPVKAGDTILLRSGYHGEIFLRGGFNSDYITIASQDGHTPYLKRIWLSAVSKWVLRGLTVSPELAPEYKSYWIHGLIYIESHGWHGPSSDVIIENCYVYSVQDTSNWTEVDWNNLASTGIKVSGPDMVVRNNTLKNINFGIVAGGDNIVAEYNKIENFAGDGMRGGGDDQVFQYNIIKNCYKVNGNHDDGIQFYTGGNPTRRVVLRGNLIIGNEDLNQPFGGPLQGIGCFDGPYIDWVVENNVVLVSHYHGISLYDAFNCRIVNNTVYDVAQSYPIWISVAGSSSDNIVRNNLSITISTGGDPQAVVDHNLLITDPDEFFMDYQNYDMRLKKGSPAIDAGSDVLAPDTDIAGNPRPYGMGYDIGAYEYTLLPRFIISAKPNQGYLPLTVLFSISKLETPNGEIEKWEWDLGDGTTSQEKEPSHTYTSAGEYTVTLTVTDVQGYKGRAQTQIVVLKKDKEFGELPTGCYNNVFNPTKGEKAIIQVVLKNQGKVSVILYDTRGSKIKQITDEEKEAGTYRYYWDGRNENGNTVGSGLYFVHIQAGDYKKTKKIVVVK